MQTRIHIYFVFQIHIQLQQEKSVQTYWISLLHPEKTFKSI